jgi:hypothetical protein
MIQFGTMGGSLTRFFLSVLSAKSYANKNSFLLNSLIASGNLAGVLGK